jgi:alpha-mannosidase
LLGQERGLLLLHAGTQYFQREASGRFSNLIMREWESHFTQEYGWPAYAEYRHGLLPHGGHLDNADRLRAAAGFARPLACILQKPHDGDLSPSSAFFSVTPPGLGLTAFRKKPAGGYELRLVECEGRRTDGDVSLHIPLTRAIATDLAGNRMAEAPLRNGRLSVGADPWKILTFHME